MTLYLPLKISILLKGKTMNINTHAPAIKAKQMTLAQNAPTQEKSAVSFTANTPQQNNALQNTLKALELLGMATLIGCSAGEPQKTGGGIASMPPEIQQTCVESNYVLDSGTTMGEYLTIAQNQYNDAKTIAGQIKPELAQVFDQIHQDVRVYEETDQGSLLYGSTGETPCNQINSAFSTDELTNPNGKYLNIVRLVKNAEAQTNPGIGFSNHTLEAMVEVDMVGVKAFDKAVELYGEPKNPSGEFGLEGLLNQREILKTEGEDALREAITKDLLQDFPHLREQ